LCVTGVQTCALPIFKGGLGSTTFYDGTAGDRIIWSSAGATGLLDGNGLDVAYAGQGDDEFYWSNSASGKGVSNFGETIYRFNIAQGDDPQPQRVRHGGLCRGEAWLRRGKRSGQLGQRVADRNRRYRRPVRQVRQRHFTQNAVTLKNDSLFADFGVTDHCSIGGVQQVVQDMYSTGHLVLSIRTEPTGASSPAALEVRPVPFGPNRHELRSPGCPRWKLQIPPSRCRLDST
jgi:hypothetical protein